VDSVFKLGHARGVCLMTVNQRGLQTFEYSPRQVKQSLTGSGSATKEQVQQLVFEELRIKKVIKHDASDALALAICHTYQMEIDAKMKRLKGEILI
jgi:crossover junction endodeoxyribonuclease RuvC